MAEKKQGLMDYGVQVLRMLLGEKKEEAPAPEAKPAKVTIQDLSRDDLMREQVRLDQKKKVLLQELRELEDAKRKYFEEGVKNASDRERAAFAREIKNLDQKAQNKERILRSLDKQKQIIEGLINIKERVEEESGVAVMIGNMDLGDLVKYVDMASIDGEFHKRKFDEILRALGQADNLSPTFEEDADVLEIMRQMEAASAAADKPEVVKESYARVEEELARHRDREDLELNG